MTSFRNKLISTVAWACMPLTLGILASSGGGGGAAAFTVEYVSSHTLTTNVSSYVFPATIDFGAEDPAREIFVVITATTGGTERSLTIANCRINGIVPVKATTSYAYNGTLNINCMFATVPTGTTGMAITVAYAGAMANCTIHVFRVVNRPGIGTNQSSGDNNDGDGGTTTSTVNAVTVGVNQFMLAGHMHQSIEKTTWPTVPPGMTLKSESSVESNRNDAGFAPIQANLSTPTMVWSWNGTANNKAVAWAFG
jgi:hypothetical protein